ncbi:MAG: VWA domain-containing protein [Acidobacteria bacterium]|nr:VWA domain-containing protein [Acidobacteriota bacterium]
MRRRDLLLAAPAAALARPAAKTGSAGGPARLVRLYVRPASEGAIDVKTFGVTLDKAPAKVVRVLTPEDPQMILIALDLVGDLGAIEPAEQALNAELERLPASTYVGLMRAQDGLTVLLDPTKDRTAASEAIRNLTISGRPGLLEALDPLEKLADAIARKAQVRLSILCITDGSAADYREDFSNPVINSSDPHDLSRQFPEALIQEKISKIQGTLATRQTPLHIVHIAYRGDRLNEAYQNGLEQITGRLSGTSALCRARAEIPEAIQRAVRAIVSEYAVIVAAPGGISPTPAVQVSIGDAPLGCRARINLQEKRP